MISVIRFFPIQLLFQLFRHNLALLFLWGLFLAMFLGGIGKVYGIHYLFLDPEYLGKTSMASFFIVGLAFGNFIMAFHITSYILVSHYFSFIGVLEKPFAKFSVNNSIVPLLVYFLYLLSIISFQYQLQTPWEIIAGYVFAVTLGSFLMTLLVFYYFKFTNKDIFKYLSGSVDKRLRRNKISRSRVMKKLKESKDQFYNVSTYLDLKLRIRNCENLIDFYDKKSIVKVFDQNHFNSVLLELILLLIVFFMGYFLDSQAFQIPAAASALLFFSMLMMFIGAISYWFRSWGVAFVLFLFIIANFLSSSNFSERINKATGLDYHKSPIEYTLPALDSLSSEKFRTADSLEMLGILDNWKNSQNDTLPKLVILCVSGGGQRAALWTLHILQQIDSLISPSIMQQTALITGASGGMIGAAFYRELYLKELLGEEHISRSDPSWKWAIAQDNLNPVIFSLIVNDLFFRFKKSEYEGMFYTRDRGYYFEQNLDQNLSKTFKNRKLADYYEYERDGRIPTLLLSPVIANDGRKLFLASHPVSFMSGIINDRYEKVRGIDFQRTFAEHRAEQLPMLNALRMSASFPYITPTISLPTTPRIEIMDAGISDNFGVEDALHFIQTFQVWIGQNTSGVILIEIRDTHKNSPIEPTKNPSLIDRFTNPISSVYNNLATIQDIKNDGLYALTKNTLHIPMCRIAFEYDTFDYDQEEKSSNYRRSETRASLSWHLTNQEKESIIANSRRKNNLRAFKELKNTVEK